MGRPRKQTVEAVTPLQIENVVNDDLQTKQEQEKEEAKGQIIFVKMYRENGRVKTADVHPSEVENCLRDGWIILEE
jgi:hypothetical protein